jgi:hypothetical protein
MPLFPRLGPLEQRSPASSVMLRHYDFLCRIRGCLWIRFPAPTLRLLVCSLAAETTAGYGLISTAPCLRASLSWSITGSPRFLRNPSCTLASVSDPGRARLASPSLAATRCCPHSAHGEDPSDKMNFGAQLRGFSTSCLRFKWCIAAPACKTRFRLVVSLCREGFEPSELH